MQTTAAHKKVDNSSARGVSVGLTDAVRGTALESYLSACTTSDVDA
jgi:hypothetical protein